VMRAVDKLDKRAPDEVVSLLIEAAGLSGEQARLCLQLASIRTTDDSFAEQVAQLGVSHPLLSTGVAELSAVIEGCAPFASERFAVEADLSIARGLDYYTGTVFETRMAGHEHLGSICSGGRYDSLATDGTTTYPGVGISLGVTRLLVPLIARGELTASRSVPSAVLVAVVSDETRAASEAVADSLRARGIACEVAASAQKYGRQIRSAERRGFHSSGSPARQVLAMKSRTSARVIKRGPTPRRGSRPTSIATPPSSPEIKRKSPSDPHA
jgi:histidyl-tRNA synthetase